MKKVKVKILDIIIDNNFKILSKDYIFISKIKKGSVDFKIFNENNEEVNLSNLNTGDIIKVYGINIDKNNIVIKKIIIQNNYILLSDSSEEFILY